MDRMMAQQGGDTPPTAAWLARTQSGDERRRRVEADAEAADETVRHSGLAAELVAAQAEIGDLRCAHGSGGGSEPQAEPAASTTAQLAAVHIEGRLLTLVCLADGAAVQVPLTTAVAESELVRSMLEGGTDATAGTVLEVGLSEGQIAAFAAFLRDPAAAAAGARRGHLLGGDTAAASGSCNVGFAALYGAASDRPG